MTIFVQWDLAAARAAIIAGVGALALGIFAGGSDFGSGGGALVQTADAKAPGSGNGGSASSGSSGPSGSTGHGL